jgi:HEAT repeat protein
VSVAPPAFVQAEKARLAGDPWTFVRVAAVSALATDGPSADIDATLSGSLKDPAALVRAAVAEALGDRRVVGSEDALVERIGDNEEDDDVRVAATGALGAMCDPRMVETLTSLVRTAALPMADEAQAKIGVAAIEALGRIHPPDLAARLSMALDPKAPAAARVLAQRALAGGGACKR